MHGIREIGPGIVGAAWGRVSETGCLGGGRSASIDVTMCDWPVDAASRNSASVERLMWASAGPAVDGNARGAQLLRTQQPGLCAAERDATYKCQVAVPWYVNFYHVR